MSLIVEKPKNYRRRALLISFLAMILVYILWNMPDLRGILYPINLFVTYIHEAGHSLAAILTGGSVHSFVVSQDGSGLARTIGGNPALIMPAGYLGAALFGSILFFLSNRFARYSRGIAVALGLFMLVFTVLFARADESGAPVAIMIGSVFGALLAFSGLKGPTLLNMLLLNVLAVSAALEALFDLIYLTQNSGASRGLVTNDAAQFAQSFGLSPELVAFTWAGAAVVMFGFALWYGAYKPLRREINDAYASITTRRGKAV
ncbi:M50 family metallopeptidase [Phototrophicus methaneseepsis]|uniref:M50 family metallopeptidase n=1 Tax=Phototrophicus methaneseepsis TaxID=2710758 RepID=A0A7S8ECV5_9CHLR|nr:M50 family metallopeptidase [Phototrophicus methaneseepsis]QPC84635.1 M50 family metallopeptidase [Phototrophicus methaneseepsis]